MITHEQYLEYKKLVDEYELAQLEDDEEDERDYDPYCEDCGRCPCRCEANKEVMIEFYYI